MSVLTVDRHISFESLHLIKSSVGLGASGKRVIFVVDEGEGRDLAASAGMGQTPVSVNDISVRFVHFGLTCEEEACVFSVVCALG